MTKQQGTGLKKKIIESIERLATLDPNYFKEGVVDVLQLLYEQDVTMTNVIAKRLEATEARLQRVEDIMVGISIGLLINTKGRALYDDELSEILSLFNISPETIEDITRKNTFLKVFKKFKKATVKDL